VNYLGKFLQKRLNELGLSEREMAKRCNFSHSYLNQLIKGTNPKTNKSISPTLETLKKLSNGFNVSVENLQKIANGEPEEEVFRHKGFSEEAFMDNLEKNATEKGVPVGSNLDKIIPWEQWNEIKKAQNMFLSIGLDPSEYDQNEWNELLEDIILVVKLHQAKKIK